jgi:hypothetical protein
MGRILAGSVGLRRNLRPCIRQYGGEGKGPKSRLPFTARVIYRQDKRDSWFLNCALLQQSGGGWHMTFQEVLAQVIAWLQREQ